MKIGQVLDNLFNGNNPPAHYSILIVSDDPAALPKLCQIIEDQGHTVHSGLQLNEGIELVKTMDKPDLIILDFINPEADAHDLLDKARIRFGKSTTPPILFLRDTPEDEEAALELFADDVLLKPVEPQALLERVNTLAAKAEAQDEDIV